jgi:hypothetical protein
MKESPFFRAVAHVPSGHPETHEKELFEAENAEIAEGTIA